MLDMSNSIMKSLNMSVLQHKNKIITVTVCTASVDFIPLCTEHEDQMILDVKMFLKSSAIIISETLIYSLAEGVKDSRFRFSLEDMLFPARRAEHKPTLIAETLPSWEVC